MKRRIHLGIQRIISQTLDSSLYCTVFPQNDWNMQSAVGNYNTMVGSQTEAQSDARCRRLVKQFSCYLFFPPCGHRQSSSSSSSSSALLSTTSSDPFPLHPCKSFCDGVQLVQSIVSLHETVMKYKFYGYFSFLLL